MFHDNTVTSATYIIRACNGPWYVYVEIWVYKQGITLKLAWGPSKSSLKNIIFYIYISDGRHDFKIRLSLLQFKMIILIRWFLLNESRGDGFTQWNSKPWSQQSRVKCLITKSLMRLSVDSSKLYFVLCLNFGISCWWWLPYPNSVKWLDILDPVHNT